MDPELAPPTCPSCGGAGGGPLGRAGSSWDTEEYVCPRCDGLGVLILRDAQATPVSRPGVAKASSPPPAFAAVPKRVVGKA
jgi:hypothetical protein